MPRRRDRIGEPSDPKQQTQQATTFETFQPIDFDAEFGDNRLGFDIEIAGTPVRMIVKYKESKDGTERTWEVEAQVREGEDAREYFKASINITDAPDMAEGGLDMTFGEDNSDLRFLIVRDTIQRTVALLQVVADQLRKPVKCTATLDRDLCEDSPDIYFTGAQWNDVVIPALKEVGFFDVPAGKYDAVTPMIALVDPTDSASRIQQKPVGLLETTAPNEWAAMEEVFNRLMRESQVIDGEFEEK